MSTISNAYDAMLDKLEAALPEHKRLPNPYSVDQNSERFLEQGYGIVIGSGSRGTSGTVTGKTRIERTMSVVISRKAFALEEDADKRASTQKLLMEDQRTLITLIESDSTMNQTVVKTDYVSDSGIQFVSGDRDSFIYLSTDFQVTYFEGNCC